MTGDVNCPHCGARHTTPVHVIRCELRKAVLDEVATFAATLDQPPTGAELADLHAHMAGVFVDGVHAARAMYAVLNLGWRPTVGAA